MNGMPSEDWQLLNARIAAAIGAIYRMAGRDCLVQFYFDGEGWICAVLPEHPFPGDVYEIDGHGLDPLSAAIDAQHKVNAAVGD